jgi:mono/diheme cytochrome c family protein
VTTRKKTTFLAMAGFVLLLAAGGGAYLFFDSAATPPSAVETQVASLVKRTIIPLRARGLSSPAPADAKTLGAGRGLFMASCAVCHGNDGRSQTDLGRGMYPPAPDLTSAVVQRWSEAELFWIVRNGIRLTGMPSFRDTLSDTETWEVARFVKALPEINANAARRQQQSADGMTHAELRQLGRELIQREACQRCHLLHGSGARIGPDLTVEWARGRTDEWLIGHFQDPKAFTKTSLMPSFSHLSEVELRALVAFLQEPSDP